MTVEEFDVSFDVMYNNITSNQAPGLNKYEKSVFLTQAQNQLVREYFNQRVDQAGGGYDGNQKRQYDFSCITKHTVLTQIQPSTKFDQRSFVYVLPDDWFLTLNEQLTITHTVDESSSEKLVTVVPVSMDEYNRLISKPYKYPNKNQAWRIITGKGINETIVDREVAENYKGDWPNIGSLGSSLAFSRLGEPLYIEVRFDYNVEAGTLTPINGIYYCTPDTTGNQLFLAIKNIIIANSTNSNITVTYESSDEELYDSVIDIKGATVLTINSHGTYYETHTITYNSPIIELIVDAGNMDNDGIQYRLRYVRKPQPIVLENLSNYSVSIDGVQAVTECELPEVTHKEILERAVIMAKSIWVANTQQQNNQRERSDR